MPRVTQLITTLEADCSDDYWSDVAVVDAEALARTLTPADWQAVQARWHQLTATAQARLADVTSDLSQPLPEVVALLVEMLGSRHEVVVDASLSSLHALVRRGTVGLDKNRLRGILAGLPPGGPIRQKLFSSLVQQLGE